MTRRKNVNWDVGEPTGWNGAWLAVLMDIRDELRRLNQLLHCENFLMIPDELHQISRNTMKRERVKH